MNYSRLKLQTSFKFYYKLLLFFLFFKQNSQARDHVYNFLKSYFNNQNIVLLNQGRIAIYLAIKANISDSKKEVILSPYTLYEVVNMVIYAGAKPVFIDPERNSVHISPDDIKKKITPNTSSILLTHYHYPNPKTIEIKNICEENKITLIEDAAVSLGAKINGLDIGTIGDYGCFSFGTFKVVNAVYGGFLICKNKFQKEKIESLQLNFKKESKYRLFKRVAYSLILDFLTYPIVFRFFTFPLISIGFDSKNKYITNLTRADVKPSLCNAYPEYLKKIPNNIQFDLAMLKLKSLESERLIRERRAMKYIDGFKKNTHIIVPKIQDNLIGSWTEFPIISNKKRDLFQFLLKNKIDVRFYYYRNCANLDIYKDYFISCPNAEELMLNTLMLPLYPRYPEHRIDKIIRLINLFFKVS